MSNDIEHPDNPRNGKAIAGIILLAVGAVLLFRQFDFFFVPHWLFSWPMWIIAFGLYMGGKYNFRKPVWIWMIALGTAFLFTENVDNSERVVWPLAIIGVGTWMVMRHNRPVDAKYPGGDYKEV